MPKKPKLDPSCLCKESPSPKCPIHDGKTIHRQLVKHLEKTMPNIWNMKRGGERLHTIKFEDLDELWQIVGRLGQIVYKS